jgi:hypothetical protein
MHKQLDEIADFLGSLKFSLFVDLHELFSSCDVTRRVGVKPLKDFQACGMC